ncbi:DUF3558 domain-containing protein [Rhodococcus sp. NPDC060090]|uniref:DUF3558 domain-containing protein n=1 Tax=Rhodococcus sp. NPDC060090 TaxID=3347056 RepID=UPI00365A29FE
MPVEGTGRTGRISGIVAMAALAGVFVAGCGSSADDQGGSGPETTGLQVTEPGPFFGECGSISDDEVQAAFALGEFSAVTRNSVGCEWETYVGGPSVSFSWYRGSPIGRERAGSDLIGRPAVDVEIGGHPGFMGSAQNELGQTVLCEIGVDFGGDFIHWSVTYANFTPTADSCAVARDLAELSVERSQS